MTDTHPNATDIALGVFSDFLIGLHEMGRLSRMELATSQVTIDHLVYRAILDATVDAAAVASRAPCNCVRQAA